MDARTNPFIRQQMIAQARGELDAWMRKFRDVKEFAGIVAALDKELREAA